MHSYLKTIGFSNIKDRIDVEKLIQKVIEAPSVKMIAKTTKKSSIVEYTAEFADGVGITVRGEIDENGQFHFEHYFPYLYGINVSTKEEVYINKRIDTDALTGMCDDYRIGVSLIFYLQNAVEFHEIKRKRKFPITAPITLSALAQEGKIILPTEKNEDKYKNNIENAKKSKLIAEAKNGDQEAIDSLTIDDIDLYATVSRRIRYEDVYSIVESSFIPYGSESDIYSILGTILDVRSTINTETNEKLFVMQIDCNQLLFEICINSNDLQGEPGAGRRFRGIIWMQGYVDFMM